MEKASPFDGTMGPICCWAKPEKKDCPNCLLFDLFNDCLALVFLHREHRIEDRLLLVQIQVRKEHILAHCLAQRLLGVLVLGDHHPLVVGRLILVRHLRGNAQSTTVALWQPWRLFQGVVLVGNVVDGLLERMAINSGDSMRMGPPGFPRSADDRWDKPPLNCPF